MGLFHTTGPKLTKLARKHRPLAPVLREFILRLDTPLDHNVDRPDCRQCGHPSSPLEVAVSERGTFRTGKD